MGNSVENMLNFSGQPRSKKESFWLVPGTHSGVFMSVCQQGLNDPSSH